MHHRAGHLEQALLAPSVILSPSSPRRCRMTANPSPRHRILSKGAAPNPSLPSKRLPYPPPLIIHTTNIFQHSPDLLPACSCPPDPPLQEPSIRCADAVFNCLSDHRLLCVLVQVYYLFIEAASPLFFPDSGRLTLSHIRSGPNFSIRYDIHPMDVFCVYNAKACSIDSSSFDRS